MNKKNKRNKLVWVFYFALIALPALLFAGGGELHTLNLLNSTIKGISSCSHYRVSGVCFWLDCDWDGCDINETLKVDHYLPDTVVTVYREKDSNPWDYANTVIDPVAYQVGQKLIQAHYGVNMGSGNKTVNSPRDGDNHFKEVDIIGNPFANVLGHFGIFLSSQTTPFVPYYSSLADALSWRSGLIEMLYPSSIIPGMHEVGSFPFNVWGNLYPRTGFVDQPCDAKGAAVITQRAADIVTHAGQPHVYKKLSQDCGDECDIETIKENDKNTQFQLVYPSDDSDCEVFGKNDTFQPKPWREDDAASGNGNYAWLMWRHYHGCIQGDGDFLYSIDW